MVLQLVRNTIDDHIYSIKLQIRRNLQGSLTVRVWIQLPDEFSTATARVGTVYSTVYSVQYTVYTYVLQMQQHVSVNTCWDLHYKVEQV